MGLSIHVLSLVVMTRYKFRKASLISPSDMTEGLTVAWPSRGTYSTGGAWLPWGGTPALAISSSNLLRTAILVVIAYTQEKY